MRIRIVLGACVSTAVLAVAGCGSGSGGHSGASSTRSSTTASTTASTTTARSTGGSLFGAPSGREVFASACQVCHSISGHSRPSQQGGDLGSFHGSHAELRQLTAEMPVVHHKLSSAEISAVVAYLEAIESHR